MDKIDRSQESDIEFKGPWGQHHDIVEPVTPDINDVWDVKQLMAVVKNIHGDTDIECVDLVYDDSLDLYIFTVFGRVGDEKEYLLSIKAVR